MRFYSSSFYLACLIVHVACAQKREFSFNEVFTEATSPATRPLPDITGWQDGAHYLEIKTVNGKPALFSVSVTSGQEIVNTEKNEQEAADGIALPANAVNVNPSPNGKWVAFVRHHDLWLQNRATGLQTALTTDGSDDVYSGYAAWVYYEEMFGRDRRAFWWSPDSRHLCFMRFDESLVPVWSILNSAGKQGSWEKCHYPQPGDKNPALRLGIVSVGSSVVTWAGFEEKDDQYLGPVSGYLTALPSWPSGYPATSTT